jgi:hypothetical protein
MPVLPPDCMLLPGQLLLFATPAVLVSQAALDNTAAVASLASALTSLAKRAVQHITAAADLQSQPAAAGIRDADAVAAYFPAAARYIAADCVAEPALVLTKWIRSLQTAASGTGNTAGGSSSSSRSSSQAAASAALLAVVLARSLVQLADAMEAAGPEVYLKSLLGRPVFRMQWLNEPAAGGHTYSTLQVLPVGRVNQHTAEVQWQVWQLRVLQLMQHLWAAFKAIGLASSAAAAGEPAATAASTSAAASETLAGHPVADPQEGGASSSSGSSSNSSRADPQAKWGYLLRLQQCSRQWAAAVAAYGANQPNWQGVEEGTLPSTGAAAEQHSQQYAEAVGLCRALAAAAPLPVVCNNPSCGNMDGVSEAAAASKRCSVCHCRYCSVACQKADWKRHKIACRRMAAAGQACV